MILEEDPSKLRRRRAPSEERIHVVEEIKAMRAMRKGTAPSYVVRFKDAVYDASA